MLLYLTAEASAHDPPPRHLQPGALGRLRGCLAPVQRELVLSRMGTGYGRSWGSPQTKMLKYLFMPLQICSTEPIIKAV